MNLNHKITELSPICARVQIARTETAMQDSALNRYEFIFEDAVKNRNDGKLNLSWQYDNNRQTVLEAADAEGKLLFRMTKAAFANNGAWVEFELFDDNEDWIGFGDQTRERIYHRGYKANCEVSNVASYIPVPFFMSNRNYAIMVNTTYQTVFDMGCTDKKRFCWFDKSSRIDFYVWTGRNFKDMINTYTLLTGRPQLPPKWSFGLWYICRTQANDEEVLSNARLFREYNIPCDVIGLEPDWMDTFYDYSVDKKWNDRRFHLPDWQINCHHTFIKALKRMGYKLELWLCNDYDLGYEEERRIGKNNAETESDAPVFCKDAELDEHFSQPVLSDKLTKPEEPWFKHLEKFVDWGADFFKQDGALQVCKHPDRYWLGSKMLDCEMHNLYPLLYSRQMNEGFAQYTNRRPLVFTVSGWAGFQHYCGTWTGDTGGRIETLGAMLNTACVGHSWVTNDMEVAQAEGIHFGYLLPWSQINSWTYFRMPWLQGKEFLAMHQYYSQLRSRLIPYLYSCAYNSTRAGEPMLMPLAIEYQYDAQCKNLLHEYLLGSGILVTIYRHDIYLPSGQWKDFWSGKVYSGNQQINDFTWPENRGGGMFLRSGAIIPMTEVMSHTEEKPVDKLDLLIFPGDAQHAEFVYYEDDGVSFEYRNGQYAESLITLDKTAAGWSVNIQRHAQSQVQSYAMNFSCQTAPKQVLHNGVEIQGVFDAERSEIILDDLQAGTVEIIC